MSGAFGSKRTQSVAPSQTGVVGFADDLITVSDNQVLTNRTPSVKGSYGSVSGYASMVTILSPPDSYICPADTGAFYGNEFIPESGSEWGDHFGFEADVFVASSAISPSRLHLYSLHGASPADSPRVMFTRQITATGVTELLVRLQEDGGTLDPVFQLTGLTDRTATLRYEQKVLSDSQIRIAVEYAGALVMPAETFTFDSAGRSTRVSALLQGAIYGTRVRLYRSLDSGVVSVDSIPTLIS